MKFEKQDCQLIGAGRLGRALSMALTQASYRFTWIGSRNSKNSKALAKHIGVQNYGVGFEGYNQKAGFLFLAVPDDAIITIASEAVKAGVIGNETVAAHMSGALGSNVLDDIRSAGASVMAFHPVQTFTLDSDPGTVFKNICFDMEGDDAACRLGELVARDLGAQSIRLDPKARLLSHLAMSIASNYTVSLLHMAEEILISYAGIPQKTARKMLLPLVVSTVQNISNFGTIKALTGPVSRGDVEIIEKHLTALEGMDKDYILLYRGLARKALQIAMERGDISGKKAEEIMKIISE